MRPKRRRKTPAFRLLPAGIRPAKLIAIGLFALVVGWLIVAVGLAGMSRIVRPDLALSMIGSDARAKARLAELLITGRQVSAPAGGQAQRPTPADLARNPADVQAWTGQLNASVREQAGQLAKEALLRDPTVVPAWRTLAMLTALEGQEARASRMFYEAERISRRDLPIQLWLIEDRVRRDDIRGALHHFDIALRTNTRSWDLLFPILVAATREPAVTRELGALLATQPAWRPHFLTKFVENPPSGPGAAQLVARLATGPDFPDRDIVARTLPALVQRGDFASARQVYRSLAGSQAAAPPLRHGSSFGPNPLPPFDWILADEVGLSATPQPMRAAPGGQALEVRGASGRGGTMARQLLMLPSGSYRLQWRSGAVEGISPARIRWSIGCAQGERPIRDIDIPLADGRLLPHEATFTIPSNCTAQWLNLILETDYGPAGVGAWVAAVRISRS